MVCGLESSELQIPVDFIPEEHLLDSDPEEQEEKVLRSRIAFAEGGEVWSDSEKVGLDEERQRAKGAVTEVSSNEEAVVRDVPDAAEDSDDEGLSKVAQPVTLQNQASDGPQK